MICIMYNIYIYDKEERERDFPKFSKIRVPTNLFGKTEYQKCSAKEFLLHKNIFVVILLK